MGLGPDKRGSKRSYGKKEYTRDLALNAATTPRNLGALIGVLAIGIVVGAPLGLAVTLAGAVYGIGSALTFFDPKTADGVLARGKSGASKASGRSIEEARLSREINAAVEAVQTRAERIQRAIDQAELPYSEVSIEVDGFVSEALRSAKAANLIHEALVDMPVADIRRRLREARKGGEERLSKALSEQLEVAEKLEKKLLDFFAEMDRLCVELDTVRAHLVSSASSTEEMNQRRLAEEVSGLREEMGAVAYGVEKAYSESPV